jgi:drug/metabolite transporter (DMT)-like permease
MQRRLTLSTALLLTVPPLLWAGNAIVGRLVRDAVPPMTLNLLRWFLALLILLPLGRAAFIRGSGALRNWRRYASSACSALASITRFNTWRCKAPHPSTSRWWRPACRSG